MSENGIFGQNSERRPAWYALYTKHQHEKSAADLLVRKQFEVLSPLYSSTRRWKDRTKQGVLLPVFPCYLFVHTTLDRKLEVVRTPGIFSMVSSGGLACEVPEQDIQMVRKICSEPSRIEPHPYLCTGETVRVRTGPFAGLSGVITRLKNGFRVVLSIALLQKSVAVELDALSLEPESRAAAQVCSN
jgi:transcription antitermination factor NusG